VTRFPTAATATVRRPPGRNKKERPKAPRETWRGRPWSSGSRSASTAAWSGGLFQRFDEMAYSEPVM
jgi:hypothetical protein